MTFLRTRNFVALILGPVRHKVLEFQVSRWADSPLFAFDVVATPRNEDHEGFEVALTLLHTEFSANFYDTRHVEYRN